MSTRRRVVQVDYDERGAPVDQVVQVHDHDRQPEMRVTSPRALAELERRLDDLDPADPNRGMCGYVELYDDVRLRCTRLTTNQAGHAQHAGVHYDRRYKRWFDRVYYPAGKLRVGRTGDDLR